jgi:hypothetical protein
MLKGLKNNEVAKLTPHKIFKTTVTESILIKFNSQMNTYNKHRHFNFWTPIQAGKNSPQQTGYFHSRHKNFWQLLLPKFPNLMTQEYGELQHTSVTSKHNHKHCPVLHIYCQPITLNWFVTLYNWEKL